MTGAAIACSATTARHRGSGARCRNTTSARRRWEVHLHRRRTHLELTVERAPDPDLLWWKYGERAFERGTRFERDLRRGPSEFALFVGVRRLQCDVGVSVCFVPNYQAEAPLEAPRSTVRLELSCHLVKRLNDDACRRGGDLAAVGT